MDTADIIFRYFPALTERQRQQLKSLGQLYEEWNSRINVISRRDIDNLYAHHVLHSLAIAKFVTPVAGTTLLDLGTGGGFPGIPLAILWPDCHFHLIDRIGKKIKVAQSVAESIGLKNVTFQHGDSGECHERFDYIISRAVMRLDSLIALVRRNILHNSQNVIPPGLLCLKGGNLAEEIEAVSRPVLEVPLSDYFTEDFYATKSLVYVEL